MWGRTFGMNTGVDPIAALARPTGPPLYKDAKKKGESNRFTLLYFA
jgi:hypothetical protein